MGLIFSFMGSSSLVPIILAANAIFVVFFPHQLLEKIGGPTYERLLSRFSRLSKPASPIGAWEGTQEQTVLVAPKMNNSTNRGRGGSTATAKSSHNPNSGGEVKDPQILALHEKYDVMQRVGTGGMAVVYRAKERASGRIVAIKIPNASLAEDDRFIRRFHREAQVLTQLNHPGIVKVFNHGEIEGAHFIAMEFLSGEGLNRLLDHEPLQVSTAVGIVQQIAEAVSYIHQLNLTHRDIKPSNIMILRDAIHNDGSVEPGGIRLMDFGIVGGQALTRLTVTGSRIGTPTYMSPEQIRGQEAGPASDIYSLGVLFYEALTGHPPFSGKPDIVFRQHLYDSPTPPNQINPKVPAGISRLTMLMLDKNPGNRPEMTDIIATLSGKAGDKAASQPGSPKAPLEAPYYLTVALDSAKGAIRIIDVLEETPLPIRILSGLGGERGMLPSPPLSIAVDRDQRIWVSVFEYGTDLGLLYCFSTEGMVELVTGSYGEKPGQFHYPAALTYLPGKNEIAVVDSELCQVQIIGLRGETGIRFGHRGSDKGGFQDPQVIAADKNSIYVLDLRARLVQIFSSDGKYQAHIAFRRAKGENEFREIIGVTVDGMGNLYLYDVEAQKVRKLGPDRKLLASFSVALEDETTNKLVFLAVDPDGGLYMAIKGGRRVYRFDPQGQPLGTIDFEAPVVALAIMANAEN